MSTRSDSESEYEECDTSDDEQEDAPKRKSNPVNISSLTCRCPYKVSVN